MLLLRNYNGVFMSKVGKLHVIYDDPLFFAGYSQLRRFRADWGYAMEHSAFINLVGSVQGRRVLDLGCGAGQLSLYLATAGAAKVISIDASERMLNVARTQRMHPCITYQLTSMSDYDYPSEDFDVVVSSLAFHYVRDYTNLMRNIARCLVPNGLLVFSTEHPIYSARNSTDGWVTGADGSRIGWALDHYAEEGPRDHHWFVDGVRRYHRTVATLVNGPIDAGFTVERVLEPAPSDEWLHDHPGDMDERRRPMFLLVRARRSSHSANTSRP